MSHQYEYPDEFLCPITLDLMEDPVIAADGFSYERRAISSWLSQKGARALSPKTNTPLNSTTLISNKVLKLQVDAFKEDPVAYVVAHINENATSAPSTTNTTKPVQSATTSVDAYLGVLNSLRQSDEYLLWESYCTDLLHLFPPTFLRDIHTLQGSIYAHYHSTLLTVLLFLQQLRTTWIELIPANRLLLYVVTITAVTVYDKWCLPYALLGIELTHYDPIDIILDFVTGALTVEKKRVVMIIGITNILSTVSLFGLSTISIITWLFLPYFLAYFTQQSFLHIPFDHSLLCYVYRLTLLALARSRYTTSTTLSLLQLLALFFLLSYAYMRIPPQQDNTFDLRYYKASQTLLTLFVTLCMLRWDNCLFLFLWLMDAVIQYGLAITVHAMKPKAIVTFLAVRRIVGCIRILALCIVMLSILLSMFFFASYNAQTVFRNLHILLMFSPLPKISFLSFFTLDILCVGIWTALQSIGFCYLQGWIEEGMGTLIWEKQIPSTLLTTRPHSSNLSGVSIYFTEIETALNGYYRQTVYKAGTILRYDGHSQYLIRTRSRDMATDRAMGNEVMEEKEVSK